MKSDKQQTLWVMQPAIQASRLQQLDYDHSSSQLVADELTLYLSRFSAVVQLASPTDDCKLDATPKWASAKRHKPELLKFLHQCTVAQHSQLKDSHVGWGEATADTGVNSLLIPCQWWGFWCYHTCPLPSSKRKLERLGAWMQQLGKQNVISLWSTRALLQQCKQHMWH